MKLLPTLSQSEVVDQIAFETSLSKVTVRTVLQALPEVIGTGLADCKRVKLAGVIIEPAMRKATKKRTGRNPATGEEVEVAAKPASVRIKLTATKPLKDAAPTVQKLRKRL
jgi:nucleoid DNA-binding protein